MHMEETPTPKPSPLVSYSGSCGQNYVWILSGQAHCGTSHQTASWVLRDLIFLIPNIKIQASLQAALKGRMQRAVLILRETPHKAVTPTTDHPTKLTFASTPVDHMGS